jgi:hypothetical protein
MLYLFNDLQRNLFNMFTCIYLCSSRLPMILWYLIRGFLFHYVCGLYLLQFREIPNRYDSAQTIFEMTKAWNAICLCMHANGFVDMQRCALM